MKKILPLLTALLLYCSIAATAQNSRIIISQAVKNSFTRVGITQARVTVMDKQGHIIDTLRTDSKLGVWTLNVPRKPATFRIRVMHPDYETGEMTVNMNHPARIYNFKLPEMLLKIKADQQLGAAVVKTTRVDAGSIRASSIPFSSGICISQKSRSTGCSCNCSNAFLALVYEPQSSRNGVLATYPSNNSTARGSSSIIAQFNFISLKIY